MLALTLHGCWLVGRRHLFYPLNIPVVFGRWVVEDVEANYVHGEADVVHVNQVVRHATGITTTSLFPIADDHEAVVAEGIVVIEVVDRLDDRFREGCHAQSVQCGQFFEHAVTPTTHRRHHQFNISATAFFIVLIVDAMTVNAQSHVCGGGQLASFGGEHLFGDLYLAHAIQFFLHRARGIKNVLDIDVVPIGERPLLATNPTPKGSLAASADSLAKDLGWIWAYS